MHPNVSIIVGAAILRMKDVLGSVATAIFRFIPEYHTVFHINIPGLNPKFLRSSYDVKSYVLLIAICLSDGDVKLDGPVTVSR